MAKRQSSRRRDPGVGAKISSLLLGPVGALLVIGTLGGGLWWQNRQNTPAPPITAASLPEAATAESILAQVETQPEQGRDHVEPGQPVEYGVFPPTSGAHDPRPTPPGFYTQEQRLEMLVHSLEHGNIVIYYDQPDAEVQQKLQGLAQQFPGAWDGVVVTPRAGLGENLILTAWTQILELEAYDEQAIAVFLDAFRGRGPENPVR